MNKRKPLTKATRRIAADALKSASKNNDRFEKARRVAAERRGWRRMAVDLEREAEQLTSAARLIRRRLSA